MRYSRASLIAVSVLATALVAGAAGCSRVPESSRAGLSAAERAAASASASATAEDTAAVKGQNPTGAVGTGGASSSSDANGSATGNGSASSGTSAKPGTISKSVDGMRVRILFWNDTSSKPLRGTELVIGSFAYKPKTSGKTDRGTTAPLVYGKTLQLVVFPDGRTGKKITVPFMVTKDMIPNSEQDAIHIAVSDGKVRILGNPIKEVDKTISRF